MSKKFSPERISGIVALSYLVFIPVGALLAWQKIRALDRDVADILNSMGLPEPEPIVASNVEKLRNILRR